MLKAYPARYTPSPAAGSTGYSGLHFQFHSPRSRAAALAMPSSASLRALDLYTRGAVKHLCLDLRGCRSGAENARGRIVRDGRRYAGLIRFLECLGVYKSLRVKR